MVMMVLVSLLFGGWIGELHNERGGETIPHTHVAIQKAHLRTISVLIPMVGFEHENAFL